MEVPRNATSYFLFGVFCVGFSGFWTGGAHQQTLAASRDAAVFAKGAERTEGSTRAVYDRTEGGGFDVDYNFRTADGRIYAGTFQSRRRPGEGETVEVEYARSDPAVSREIHANSPANTIPPIEWAGLGLGAVILVLMTKFAFDQVGASASVRGAFVGTCLAAYAGGLFWGSGMRQVRYTVQVGNEAWSSPSFTNDFIPGVKLRLEGGRLRVNGRDYGSVPNHAHIWVRDDGVHIDSSQAP